MSEINIQESVQNVEKQKSTRGRKPKYLDNNARREAKREQNRLYRERKRNELTALRRLAAKMNSESSESEPQSDPQTEPTPNV